LATGAQLNILKLFHLANSSVRTHRYLGNCTNRPAKPYCRSVRLLKQQMLITVYRLPTKESKLQISVCRRQTEVCHSRFRLPSLHIYIYTVMKRQYIYYIYLYIYMYIYFKRKRKTEAQGNFLNPFTFTHRTKASLSFRTKGSLSFVCLFMRKQKEVICLQTD
jgi:hypothetical protein